jgi:DHA2 family multidrug resistance protein-like MFS transporter
MWPHVLIFFLAAFAQTTAYIAIPFLLHGAGYQPAQIGLIFTAWPIAVLAIGPISSRLCGRYPLGILGGAGLLTMAVGLAGLALMSDAAPPLTVGLIALSGLGYGFYQLPNTHALLTAVPIAQTADATAMAALSRAIGQASAAAAVALALRRLDGQATSVSLGLAAVLALLATLVSGKRGAEPNDEDCG